MSAGIVLVMSPIGSAFQVVAEILGDTVVEPDQTLQLLVYMPVISAGIAILALFIAFRNGRTANRALRLAEAQEARLQAAVDVSIQDSLSWRDAAGNRNLAIQVLAVNPTDRNGALVEATLRVTHTVREMSIVLQIPHDNDAVPYKQVSKALNIPKDLSANCAVSGWLVFHMSRKTVPGRVDRYDLFIRDSRGPAVTIDVWAFREELD